MDQNTNLKKEILVAERKLAARNERIQTLESLLIDAQEKFRTQQTRFEGELGVMRKQLQDAVETLERERASVQSGDWLHQSGRIAKPLRGGRAVDDGGAAGDQHDPLATSASWIGSGSTGIIGNLAATLTKTASGSSLGAASPSSTLAASSTDSNRRSWFWSSAK